jgi:hypothetical protein
MRQVQSFLDGQSQLLVNPLDDIIGMAGKLSG